MEKHHHAHHVVHLRRRLILSTSLIASIITFSILAFFVQSGATSGFDSTVLLWIKQHASPLLDRLFVGFTQLGGVIGVVAITSLLLIFLVYKKKYSYALLTAMAVGGVALLNYVLKSLFDRSRPDLWEWIVTENFFSFPSGHASASMALALVVIIIAWHTFWRGWVITLAIGYVFMIGLSRMYLGVHFPTDILGGWILALAWVSGVTLLIITSRRRFSIKSDAEL